MRILALSDARASNAGQALGLAEALAARCGAVVQAEHLERRAAILDLWTTYTGRAVPFAAPDDTALVIGAGRVGAIAAASLRRRDVPAVCIMRPPLPGMRFEAVVVPEHDLYLRAGTVQTVGGLHALTDARIAAAGQGMRFAPHTAVVLLGGPSGTALFDAAGEARLFEDLTALEARGFTLVGTASRRTPKPLIGRLKDRFPQIDLWDGQGDNPYPGLLAHADVVVVTSDSVSMISEALYTGTPVIVSGSDQPSPKFRRFRDAIAPKLSTATDEFVTYTPLREAERVADQLIADGLVR